MTPRNIGRGQVAVAALGGGLILAVAASAGAGGCHILAGFAGLGVAGAEPVGGGGAGGHTSLPGDACVYASDCLPSDSPACAPMACLGGTCFEQRASRGVACGEDGSQVCDGDGRCVAAGGKEPNGAACATPVGCFAGFCVDGRCCDLACEGPCLACDAADALGHCQAHPPGENTEASCPEPGVCDGSGACASGAHLWSVAVGDAGDETLAAIAPAPDGGAYLVGDFGGAFAAGGDLCASQGARDVFVVRLGPGGVPLWLRCFGGAGDERAVAAAADAQGVYALGGFGSTIDFGDGPHTTAGGEDIFLVRLDVDGSAVWSRAFGGPGAQHATALAVTPSGLWLAGGFEQALDFGNLPLQSLDREDAFVAKLGPGGSYAWARQIGGPGDQRARALAVTSAADVVVAGTFDGSVDFDPSLPGGDLESAGGVDFFFGKYNSYGQLAGAHWPLVVGDADDQCDVNTGCRMSVAIRAVGDCSDHVCDDVVVAGDFTGQIDFGTGLLVSGGGADGYVVELFENSIPLWARSIGGAADQWVAALAVDDLGNALVVGGFSGTLDLGASLPSAGATDAFVAKLGPWGQPVWTRRFGGASADMASALSVDAVGSPFVGGSFAGAISLGGADLVPVGGLDVFVGRLDP